MLIAHEAPLSIMEKVQSLTDYDYCLVHLLEESQDYLNFFLKAKENGRKIIMDCSLFELGSAFDPQKYYNWLLKIQPDEYIVPDVWQNCQANLKSFTDFTNNFDIKALTGRSIGVLQGNTWSELEEAYLFMHKHADKVAISFGYDFYLDLYKDDEGLTKAAKFSEGRVTLIEGLMSNGVLDIAKPHHLLGCGIPLEFQYYKSQNFNFIETIDTSHPVMSGLFGKDYNESINLENKIPSKMVEVFNREVNEAQTELVIKNINKFKELCTHK
jgi:hypothetical protein